MPASDKSDPFTQRYQQYFDVIHTLETEAENGRAAATPEQLEAIKKGLCWLAKGVGGIFLPEFVVETALPTCPIMKHCCFENHL